MLQLREPYKHWIGGEGTQGLRVFWTVLHLSIGFMTEMQLQICGHVIVYMTVNTVCIDVLHI